MEIAALNGMLGEKRDGALWSMHVPAFRGFVAAQTQWRTRLAPTEHGLRTIVTGLDYAAVKVALDALAIGLLPHEWRDLMVLEREAAAALNGGTR